MQWYFLSSQITSLYYKIFGSTISQRSLHYITIFPLHYIKYFAHTRVTKHYKVNIRSPNGQPRTI